jgi:predicted branched-subunit amino acid permease
MPVSDAHWRHPEFRRGAREMIGIALGIAAWGLVTGVAMINSGIGLPLALMMSLLVFAGSAQLATVALIASGAPLWVVWATAICVNLRFVIFSAQWRPYFAHLPRRQRALLSFFTADLNYGRRQARVHPRRPERAAGRRRPHHRGHPHPRQRAGIRAWRWTPARR